jgi:hypothetical protein
MLSEPALAIVLLASPPKSADAYWPMPSSIDA